MEAPSQVQRGVEALTIKCSPSLDGFNFINRLEIKRKGTGESTYSTVLEVIDPPRGSNPNFKDGTLIFSKKTLYFVLNKSNCHNKILREEVITLIHTNHLYNHIICTSTYLKLRKQLEWDLLQCSMPISCLSLQKGGELCCMCCCCYRSAGGGVVFVALLLLLPCCCCCCCCCF